MKRAEIQGTIVDIRGGEHPAMTVRLDDADKDVVIDATFEELEGYRFGQRVRLPVLPAKREPKQ